MKNTFSLLLTAAVALAAAPAGLAAAPAGAIPAATPAATPAAVPPTPTINKTLASGLSTPWGIAFLPDGSALVSERDSANIKRVTTEGTVTTVGKVPGVRHGGEGGLMGLAVASTYATDKLVYAFHTAEGDNRIVRMVHSDTGLGAPQAILTGLPRHDRHNGGRLRFGPDGKLYAGTGDATNTGLPQNPSSLAGKILRLNPDGTVPSDNPTAGSKVFSLGHRNPQGLAFDDGGRLWSSELGQDTWDELNLIRGGKNYGWPTCEGKCNDSRFVDPLHTWRPSEASPSGLGFAGNTLWMASLRGQRLWAIPVKDGAADGDPKAFFTDEQGRLRAVERHTDGTLWLATNTGGKVLRLTLQAPSACSSVNLNFEAYPALKAGATGDPVKAAQCRLTTAGHTVAPSGTFDEATVAATKAFQTARALPATGEVDARTWTALLSYGDKPALRSGATGDGVRRLQRSLTAALGIKVTIDGQFGPKTDAAVREYQRTRGLVVDGYCGNQTWTALQAGK